MRQENKVTKTIPTVATQKKTVKYNDNKHYKPYKNVQNTNNSSKSQTTFSNDIISNVFLLETCLF